MRIKDLTAWESFYWIAKERSFTKAAAKLHIGNPLLSKRINRLETDLGVRLFQRTTRKVSLTQEGQALFPKIESFLQDAQSLEDQFEAKNDVSGTIRITGVTSFFHRVLAPLLVKFSEKYPNVKFEADVNDHFVDLIDSQMDLAIRVQEPKGADFLFKKLCDNKLVLCATPQYLKGKKKIVHPQDLHAHKVLMLQLYEHCKFIKTGLPLGELESAQKLKCESGLFLTELACQNAGVAVRSTWDVSPLIKSGKLVQVLEKHPVEPFGVLYLVVPTRRLLTHRVRVFIDFLMEEAKKWDFAR